MRCRYASFFFELAGVKSINRLTLRIDDGVVSRCQFRFFSMGSCSRGSRMAVNVNVRVVAL